MYIKRFFFWLIFVLLQIMSHHTILWIIGSLLYNYCWKYMYEKDRLLQDIYVSSNPVVCLPCIQALVGLHSFKSKCINTETTIRSYLKRHNISEETEINLADMVRDLIKINKEMKEEEIKNRWKQERLSRIS